MHSRSVNLSFVLSCCACYSVQPFLFIFLTLCMLRSTFPLFNCLAVHVKLFNLSFSAIKIKLFKPIFFLPCCSCHTVKHFFSPCLLCMLNYSIYAFPASLCMLNCSTFLLPALLCMLRSTFLVLWMLNYSIYLFPAVLRMLNYPTFLISRLAAHVQLFNLMLCMHDYLSPMAFHLYAR